MSTHKGISFTGALGLLFIGLRLSEHIDWSWWWVMSPLWIKFIGEAFVYAANSTPLKNK